MTPVAVLRQRFRGYAWGFLGYNLLVILWGAYVRASGSGAGCGAHWPSCQGQVIPQAASTTTMIEFIHRMMSGLTLAGVVVLVWLAFRHYPAGHRVRLGALLSLGFTLSEALVGAGLVLFGLTAQNDSAARAVVISIHLVNTFLLLGSLALTAWWASGGEPLQLSARTGMEWRLAATGLLVIFLGASGAVTALGDTLFPAGSLVEGMQQDLSPTAHFLLRLRIYHPVIAAASALVLFSVVRRGMSWKNTERSRKIGTALLVLTGVQLALGMTNIILLAPTWMQMVHLLAADLIWISLVAFSAEVLSARREQISASVSGRGGQAYPQAGRYLSPGDSPGKTGI